MEVTFNMTEKIKDWNMIIQDQLNSGLSIKQYCEEKHIAQSIFYKHRKKLYEDSQQPAVITFTPVEVKNENISFSIDGHYITCDRNDVRVLLEVIL